MSNFVRYFNGTEELNKITSIPNSEFSAIGGIKSKANIFDSFQRLAGISKDGILLPVERKITYKKYASLHECNSKCINGKIDGTCECSCGGKNHGRGKLFLST